MEDGLFSELDLVYNTSSYFNLIFTITSINNFSFFFFFLLGIFICITVKCGPHLNRKKVCRK